MLKINYSPSYRPKFTQRLFNTCPICAGIPFTEYKQSNLPNLTLCSHHQHDLTKFKMNKYELEDKARELQEEYKELDKILDPVKNLKRQQKILEIKSQLNEVA